MKGKRGMMKKMLITFGIDSVLIIALVFIATTGDYRVAAAIQACLWPLAVLGIFAALSLLGNKKELLEHIAKRKTDALFGSATWSGYNILSDAVIVAMLAYAGLFWLAVTYCVCGLFQYALREKIQEEMKLIG